MDEPPFIVPGSMRKHLPCLQGAPLSVICALVSFAGKKGVCWPSTAALAEATGYGRKAVFSALARLERMGFIKREKSGQRNGNRYQVNVPFVGTIENSNVPKMGTANVPLVGTANVPKTGTGKEDTDRDQRKGSYQSVLSGQLAPVPRPSAPPTRKSSLPTTEAEAVQFAAGCMIPLPFIIETFHRCEAVGWIDTHRRDIRSWPSYLTKAYADAKQRGDAVAIATPVVTARKLAV